MRRVGTLDRRLGIAILALLVGALGCRVSGTGWSVAPAVVSPTATPAATGAVAPLADETTALNDLQAQTIAVYEATAPSVVNITNRSTVYGWFGQAIPQEGSGSGFVYDREGHIVTNYHVIENAQELLVTLSTGQVYPAEIVGSDPTNDLAVLRIDAGGDLPAPLALADSDDLRVGQFVVAIGNPYGLEQTLTTGVVSALGRVIESPQDNRFIGEAIQTDAAINPGNSGGPLLDLQGRVIGVNSQILSPSGASNGIGFAVSANTVRRVVPQLIARGHYPHPWLGIRTVTITPSTAQVLREAGMNLTTESGLLVVEAVDGAPANRAGIRGCHRTVRVGSYQVPIGGDILIAINGEPIEDFQSLTVYLETHTVVGDTIEVTVIRDGETLTIPVTLAENPQG